MPPAFIIVCHLLVPIIFGGLVYWHIRDRLFLRWEVVVLASLGSLPFLLPILALYINALGKGTLSLRRLECAKKTSEEISKLAADQAKKESQIIAISIEEKAPAEDTLGAEVVHAPEKSSEALPPRKHATFSDLIDPLDADKVFRTLKHYQQTMKSDNIRWGFTVGRGAADYEFFERGVNKLLGQGLVVVDDKRMVYLTDEGMRKPAPADGDIWDTFGPG